MDIQLFISTMEILNKLIQTKKWCTSSARRTPLNRRMRMDSKCLSLQTNKLKSISKMETNQSGKFMIL